MEKVRRWSLFGVRITFIILALLPGERFKAHEIAMASAPNPAHKILLYFQQPFPFLGTMTQHADSLDRLISFIVYTRLNVDILRHIKILDSVCVNIYVHNELCEAMLS